MRLASLVACTLAFAACATDDLEDADSGGDENPDYDNVTLDDDAASPDETISLSLQNPVIAGCADPGVMRDGATWYLSCTGGGGGNHFPIYTSTDLQHWTQHGYVFPAGSGSAPAWGTGNWWAPEFHHVPGGYAVYFSALNGTKNAVGVATSSSMLPSGGFTARTTPLIARTSSLIDAHSLISVNGTHWVYFKIEGQPDTIWGHALTADGKALTAGPSTKLLSSNLAWEHGVVEAPWVIHLGSYYYLFYSGAAYCNSSYAVGVARSKHPLGPFTKRGAPILASGNHWAGPGHNSITTGPDHHFYMVYHAYRLSEGTPACAASSTDNNKRDTLVSRIVLENGWPKVIANL